MNAWLKSTLGISAAGLLALVALHGKAFIASLEAAFLFLFKLAHDAPLGVGSFALALSLAVVAQAFVARFIVVRCARSRDLIVAMLGLVIGTGVMWIQLHTLDGLLLGLLAGFMSPFAYLTLAAVASLLASAMRKEAA